MIDYALFNVPRREAAAFSNLFPSYISKDENIKKRFYETHPFRYVKDTIVEMSAFSAKINLHSYRLSFDKKDDTQQSIEMTLPNSFTSLPFTFAFIISFIRFYSSGKYYCWLIHSLKAKLYKGFQMINFLQLHNIVFY